MFHFLKTTLNSDGEPAMDAFVPAARWDELRKRYPPQVHGGRGLRSLSQAMESENPGNLEGPVVNSLWEISPMDSSSKLEIQQVEEGLAVERAVAESDACFASEMFLDDLDWALQTYDICRRTSAEEVNMDDELEMLEAVQDLTRFVARTTPQRFQSLPSTTNIPD